MCPGQAGKPRGMEKLSRWSGNIVNHFWYCCRTCDGNVNKLKVSGQSSASDMQHIYVTWSVKIGHVDTKCIMSLNE